MPDLDINHLVDALHEPVVVLDSDLRVLMANQAFYRLFNVTSLEAERHLIYQVGGECLNTNPVREILEQAHNNAAIIESKEITCDIPSTGVRTLLANVRRINNANTKKIVLLLTIEDITQRKQIEQALRDSEQRFKAQYKSLPIPTYTWQKIGEDFILIDYNEAGEQMTKGGIIHYLGKTAREMYGDRPEVLEDFEKCFESKSTIKYEGLFHIRTIGKNGEFNITYVFVSPDIVMVHIEDVTHRKQTEHEVQQYRRHLEELVAERTAALELSNKELEAFSYSIAHDLRAPLRSITGFSQILLEDASLKLNEQEQYYFQRIIANSKHLANLIDDILELSRITRSEFTEEIINLSVTAQDIVDNLQREDPDRQVTVKITPDLLCKGDARLLRSALENLLGNAWKYSSKKTQAIIEFGIMENNGEKTYYVRDNGAGFDMSYAQKLFKPFHRLHKNDEFEGTGIGLATVQRVIARHSGWIWAESEIDKGATFCFTLKTSGANRES